MVRNVKIALRKTLGKARLTFEELSTVLAEIECVINTQHLTYVYDDVSEPLTPSHLLFGRNINDRPQSNVNILETNVEDCVKRVKYLQITIQQFWKRFKSSYLNELREHHLLQKKKHSDDPDKLVVGDIVIIKEDYVTPCSLWKTGKIVSLVVGNDGMVTGAILTMISEEGRRTKLTRPVQKLIPMEISNNSTKKNSVTIDDEKKLNIRPKRNAALTGELILRTMGQC